MSNCPVCLDEYTKKLRIEKTCSYCNKGACLVCIKRYILQSMAEPNCLHCSRAFTNEILDGLFTKHFRKTELRRHRIQLLMDQERSLFRQTIGVVEREDAHEAYLQAHNLHLTLIQRLSPRDTAPIDPQLIHAINEIRVTIAKLLARVAELGVELNKPKCERREFIKKCPTCPEGFLSTAWRCALCKTRACSHCLSVKGVGIPDGDPDPQHECKEEDLLSAKTIQEETKPCPHCGVRVQKSEGCMQMWCTACNNAFDWRTGQKVNGPVHNPHFHEFQRGMAGGAGGAQAQNGNWHNNCEQNRDPTFWPWIYSMHLINQLQQKCGHPPTTNMPQVLMNRIADVNRLMIERSMSARQYTPYGPASYEDLRKRRIRRQIDDAAWARLLSSRETRREKENRLRLLDELLLAVGRDIIGSLLQKSRLSHKEIEDTLGKPLEAAREYYNQELRVVAEDGGSLGSIDARWVLRFV
jgi:hypothetical protein